MRRHLTLVVVIVALAALLFACSSSNDNGGGGNNPPAVGKGNLAVTVNGASVTGASIAAPSQIDCRLKDGDTVVDTWSPTAFETSGGSYTFTWADLDEGTYTLEADLGWNGSTEVTGSTVVTVVKDETTSVTVDAAPVDVVSVGLASSGVWQPSDPSTPGPDTYTTPSGAGIYRPQWFKFGPIPAPAAGQLVRVSVGLVATAPGPVTFFAFQAGSAPVSATVQPGGTISVNIASPVAGYVWAMVFGPAVGGVPAAAQYQIRFIFPYTTP